MLNKTIVRIIPIIDFLVYSEEEITPVIFPLIMGNRVFRRYILERDRFRRVPPLGRKRNSSYQRRAQYHLDTISSVHNLKIYETLHDLLIFPMSRFKTFNPLLFNALLFIDHRYWNPNTDTVTFYVISNAQLSG